MKKQTNKTRNVTVAAAPIRPKIYPPPQPKPGTPLPVNPIGDPSGPNPIV